MKKAIKIALIVLLAISMLFVLTGCGKEDEKIREKDSIKDNEEIISESKDSESENLESEDKENEETEVDFSMGEWNGNAYENEFLGLKFNLPTGWTYSSDEEIAQMMNVGAELLGDDLKMAAEMAKLTSVYYMVANNPNTGDSVTILTEKPVMDVTTEYYLNQLKTQLQSVQSMNYEIGNTSKEKISGKEFDTLTVTASMSGIEVSQKYYVHKMGEYFIGIIVTSTSGESNINSMIKNFQ